ncbi:MAG: glycoside hydrolase family 11 protein [Treponema sp.]|nr:glycoside hydrolase family 11 protein [Treponema sp.]
MKKYLFGISIMLLLVCFFFTTCNTTGRQTEAERVSELTAAVKAAGGDVFSGDSKGNQQLPETPYGYEIWSNGASTNNRLFWYGPYEKGGAAFRAEWRYSGNFLGRVGYYWNEGKPYTAYDNVFCDFEFTRSPNGTGGNFSYIGIYGWTRNPLIEWYISEDWFGGGIMGAHNIGGGARKVGEFTVDGSVYFIFRATRPTGSPSIDGPRSFDQFISIRQSRRQSGTISITEHFKEWEKLGMKLGTNMYEAKFLVEAGDGIGWFDASYLSFYMKKDGEE